MWRTDPYGQLVVDMPAWRSHTGQTEEEILGKGWVDAVHPDHRVRVIDTFEEAIRSGAPYECEYPILSPEGQRREIVARGVPLLEDGNVIEWVGTTTDVTTQRRGEERLKRETRTVQTLSKNFALLANVSESLSASLDTRQIADRLATLVTQDLADWACVYLVSPNGEMALAALRHPHAATQGLLTEIMGSFPVHPDDSSGPGRVLRSGKPELIASVPDALLVTEATNPEYLEMIQKLRLNAALVMPLAARGHVLGTLSLVRESEEPFAHTEFGLCEEIARRAGMALDNASLYERERLAAITLQRSLLPQALPTLPGAVCAARYVPGAAGTEVGGDWYDVIPLDEEMAVYVVGDVMGRGVAAAAIMGQLRSAVRAYSLDGHSPAEVIQRVDRMVNTLDDPPITTCVVARYNGQSRELEIATAGHLPPVLVHPGGRPEIINLDPGLPLGVGGATFQARRLALPVGATLLLFTDGLVENPTQTVDEGFAKLSDAAANAVEDGATAEQIADAILRQMRRDDEQDDDDTALLILTATEPDAQTPVIHLEEEFELPAQSTAPREARRKVTEVLSAWQLHQVLDTATLLVSELVTNAVRHARSTVRITITVEGERLRAGIWDHNLAPLPTPGSPGATDAIEQLAEGGRGLFLVQELADNWGTDTTADGKCVWFELQTAPVNSGI